MPHRPFGPLCALLVALWHSPVIAQGNPVDLDDAEAAAAPAEAGPVVVATRTFLFAFGALGLEGSATVLDALVERLASDDALRVRVDAHTDNVGWALGNVELSRRRARTVAFELIERGVAVERIAARAFGESRPAASNATAEGRRRNRRVAVSLLR